MSYPLTYTGNGIIKIMSVPEFNGLAQAVLEHMAVNDGPGSIYTANAAGNTLIGTFTDTRFAGNIGDSNVTILSTEYELYQDLQTPTGTEPPLPLVYNTEQVPISLMNTGQLDQMAANILSFCVNQEGPNSYVLEPSAPSDGGTWTSLGEIKDIYSGGIDTKKYLFKKLTSGSYNLFRPLKSFDNGILREFSDAEINYISKKVREQIVTTGIGKYLFQSATPSPGTWVSKGSITNTIATESSAEYTSVYTEELTYTKDSTEVYNITRDENYTGSQPVYYSGLRLIYSGIGEIEYTIQSEVNTTYYDTVYSSASYVIDGIYAGPLLGVSYAGVGAYTSDINFTGPVDYTLDIYIDDYDVLYSGPGELDYQLDTLYTTDFTSEYSTTVFETFSIDVAYQQQSDVVYSGPADIIYTSESLVVEYVGTAPATYTITVFETFTSGSIYTGLESLVYSGPAEANYDLSLNYEGTADTGNYTAIVFETFNQPIVYTGITTVIYSGPGEIGYTFDPVYTGLSDTALYSITQYSGPNTFTVNIYYAGPTFYSNAYYTGPIVYTQETVFYTIQQYYTLEFYTGPGIYSTQFYTGEGVFEEFLYTGFSAYLRENLWAGQAYYISDATYYTGPLLYSGSIYSGPLTYTSPIQYLGTENYTLLVIYGGPAIYDNLLIYTGPTQYTMNHYTAPGTPIYVGDYYIGPTLGYIGIGEEFWGIPGLWYAGPIPTNFLGFVPGIEGGVTYEGPLLEGTIYVHGPYTTTVTFFVAPNYTSVDGYFAAIRGFAAQQYTGSVGPDTFIGAYYSAPTAPLEFNSPSVLYQGPVIYLSINYVGPQAFAASSYTGQVFSTYLSSAYTGATTYLGPSTNYTGITAPTSYLGPTTNYEGVPTPSYTSWAGTARIDYVAGTAQVTYEGPPATPEPTYTRAQGEVGGVSDYSGPTEFYLRNLDQFGNQRYFAQYEGSKAGRYYTGVSALYFINPPAEYYDGPELIYYNRYFNLTYLNELINTQGYGGDRNYTNQDAILFAGPTLFFSAPVYYTNFTTFTNPDGAQFDGPTAILYTNFVGYLNLTSVYYTNDTFIRLYSATNTYYSGQNSFLGPSSYYSGLTIPQQYAGPVTGAYTNDAVTQLYTGVQIYTLDVLYTGPTLYFTGQISYLGIFTQFAGTPDIAYTLGIIYTNENNLLYDGPDGPGTIITYTGPQPENYVSPLIYYTGLNPAQPDANLYTLQFFTNFTGILTYTGSYETYYTGPQPITYVSFVSYSGLNPALPDANPYTTQQFLAYTGLIYYTGFYDSEYAGFMIQDYVAPTFYTGLDPAQPDSQLYTVTIFQSYTGTVTYTGSYDSVYTLINTQYYTITELYTGLNPALPDQNIYTLIVDVLYTGSIETIQYTMEYYTSYYTGDNSEYYATNLYTASPILYDRSYTGAFSILYDTDYTRDVVQYYLNLVFYTNDSFQIQYGSPAFYVNETYLGSYTSNSAEYGATDYNAFAQGFAGPTVTFFIGGSPAYFTGIAWATEYTGLVQYVNNIYNFPEIIAYTTSKDENEYYTNSFVSYTGPSTANFTGTSYYTLNLYEGLVFTNYGGPGTDYTGADAFLSYAGTPITYTSPTPPFFNTFVGYFDGFLAGLYTGVQDFTTYLGNLYTGITNTYTGENYTGLAPIYYASLSYNDYYQGPAFYLGEVTTYTDEIIAFYEIFYGSTATYYAGSYTRTDVSLDFYIGTNFGVPGPSYYLGTTRVYNGYTSGIGYTLGNMVYLISEYAGFTGTEGSYGGYTQSAYVIGFTSYDTGPSFTTYLNVVDENYTQTFTADYTNVFDGGTYTQINEYNEIYTSPIITDIPVTGTTITLWRRVA